MNICMYHIIYIPKINQTQHPHYPQNCWRRSYWSLLVLSQHYPLGPYRIREIHKVPLKEKSSQCPSYHKAFFLGDIREKGIWFRAAQGIFEQCDATKRLALFGVVGKWEPIFSPGKLWQGMVTKRIVRIYKYPLSIEICEDGVTIPQIAWHVW